MKSFNYPAIFFFCLFLLSAFAGNAQKRPERLWKGGQLDAQIGVGLLSTFVADKARAITPPVTIGGTYLLNDKFSLGLQYGYSSAEKNREILGQKIKWRNNYYTFSLRTGFIIPGEKAGTSTAAWPSHTTFLKFRRLALKRRTWAVI